MAAMNPLRAAGQYVRQLCPHIGDTYDPMRSNTACWFIDPEQHVIEWLVMNAIVISIIVGARRAGLGWRVHMPADPRDSTKSAWVWVDRAIGVCAVAVYLATVRFKVLSDNKIFLLQPCHLQNLAIIIMALTRSEFGAVVFNVYLHTQFGAWLALLSPDTSELFLWGEAFSFFFQHVMLVTVPMYYIARRRFPLYERRALYSWALFLFFHLNVLVPVSLLTGRNMNYTMNPPPGPLADMGPMYRSVSIAGFIVLEIICRSGLAEGMCRLVNRHPHPSVADKANGNADGNASGKKHAE